jgi:hypothetical protein
MLESLRPEFWLQLVGYAAMLIVAYFGLRQTVALVLQRVGFLEKKIDEKTSALEAKIEDKTEDLEDALKRETDAQNRKIDMQSTEIGKLGELLVKTIRHEERLARQDEHILLLRKEFDDLKHGQGFINGPRLANAAVP